MLSNGAHEHGVCVTLGEEQYWIVGYAKKKKKKKKNQKKAKYLHYLLISFRRSSIQGTFFVCYSSQAPQSVVEMAFKAQFFSNQYI
jgi:hypothetical protein